MNKLLTKTALILSATSILATNSGGTAQQLLVSADELNNQDDGITNQDGGLINQDDGLTNQDDGITNQDDGQKYEGGGVLKGSKAVAVIEGSDMFTYTKVAGGAEITGFSTKGNTVLGLNNEVAVYIPRVDTQGNPVKSIGANSFSHKDKIVKVSFTQATELTKIGRSAFGYASIRSVSFNNANLKEIGAHSFDMNKITSLDLNKAPNLELIGDSAFSGNSITELKLNKCVRLNEIGSNAFYHATAGGTLDLSRMDNLTKIGGSAFEKCRYTAIQFSNSGALTYIGNQSFMKSNLTKLDLSILPNLTYIGSYSFSDSMLTSLNLRNLANLEVIRTGAFWNSRLTSLDFTDCISLEEIGFRAFSSSKIPDLDLTPCTNLRILGADLTYEGPFANSTLKHNDLSKLTRLETIGTTAFKTKTSKCDPLILPDSVKTFLVDLSGGAIKIVSGKNPNNLACGSGCLVNPPEIVYDYKPYIVDKNGIGVPGVTVTLTNKIATYTAISDQSGQLHFENIKGCSDFTLKITEGIPENIRKTLKTTKQVEYSPDFSNTNWETTKIIDFTLIPTDILPATSEHFLVNNFAFASILLGTAAYLERKKSEN